jgi:hypothetical protein
LQTRAVHDRESAEDSVAAPKLQEMIAQQKKNVRSVAGAGKNGRSILIQRENVHERENQACAAECVR